MFLQVISSLAEWFCDKIALRLFARRMFCWFVLYVANLLAMILKETCLLNADGNEDEFIGLTQNLLLIARRA